MGARVRWKHFELWKPLGMPVDLAASAPAKSEVEVVLDLSQAERPVVEALLADAVIAIRTDFAGAAQSLERIATSLLLVHSRLGWTALFGENKSSLETERFGLDVGRSGIEPVAENK